MEIAITKRHINARNVVFSYGCTIVYLFAILSSMLKAEVTFDLRSDTKHKHTITFSFIVPPGDFIYKDYLAISVDHPDIMLSDWISSIEAIPYYDTVFKETKKIFNQSFTINQQIELKADFVNDAHIHITYYQHSKKQWLTTTFPLLLNPQVEKLSVNHYIDIAPILEAKYSTITSPPYKISLPATSFWQEYLALLKQFSTIIWFKIMLIFALCMLIYLLPWMITLSLVICLGTFYTLYLFLPWHILLLFVSCCMLCMGLYILCLPQKNKSAVMHMFIMLIGMLMLTSSMLGFAKAYSETYLHRKQISADFKIS